MTLPGLGYVEVEEGGATNGVNSSSASVIMIDVHITQFNLLLGLSPGDRILVGAASTKFERTAGPFSLAALSYGFRDGASGGPASSAMGPVAQATIGCAGGSFQAGVASLRAGEVGSLGTVIDTANGRIVNTQANASSRSSISNVDLLGGVVKAGAVTASAGAQANGSTAGGSASFDLTKLEIAGRAMSATPGANVRIVVANLGTVILNHQWHTSAAGTYTQNVDAIDIYVSTANSLNLPVGTFITIGHAQATASRAT